MNWLDTFIGAACYGISVYVVLRVLCWIVERMIDNPFDVLEDEQ